MKMNIDWLREAERLSDELTALRRAFHRCPELGNREYMTAERIEEVLHGCGVETERILGTAVVGRLQGALPGPVVAIRADMDALPIQEETGADFASETAGVMHACGHDVHMTAALGAAKLLSAHRGELPGSVVFLFQPDEEGNGGARRMIEAGALQGVDAVFGCHAAPGLPADHAAVRYGKFYAASDTFRLTLTGKSAHGAEREKGVDALAAAARLIPELLSLPELFPGERSVVTVGTLHSGTAVNIVPGSAELTGIIRTLGPDARVRMRERMRETVAAAAEQTRVRAELHVRESFPGVVNDEAMTRFVFDTAAELLGAEHVSVIETPTMTSEDFGEFLMERPGSFYHIGSGCARPLHSADFLPEDSSAVTGAALHAAVAAGFLSERLR